MRSGRCGGEEAVGETQKQPFQLSFNSSLKVDFQGSRVTSDGGLVLVRELDERLGLSELVDRHFSDSRRGKNIQLPLADLLRQSIYSRLAGYEDVNDAERLSQDPTFRLIGSRKIWERRAALTSRLQSFETEVLAQEENLAGLATLNRELIARAEASMPSKRLPTEREWRSAGEGATPRRHWADAEKLAMVRECETPGSSVSVVSRRYDINSNMLFNWRNQVRRGVIG